MGKRRTGRKLAMQALYQAEIRQTDDMDELLDEFIRQSEFAEETKEWAIELASKAWYYRPTLDELIAKYSIDWEFDRINAIDKSLLRMGLYELRYMDTDSAVVINEILEIAKRYSTDESPRFINGILGNYVKKEWTPPSSAVSADATTENTS